MADTNSYQNSTGLQLQEKTMTSTTDDVTQESTYMMQPGVNGVKVDETQMEEEEVRDTWGRKIDFVLSVVGFSVDLANVWRFPYLCYKNGGGAFLIPYVLMLLAGGIPLFYMELALGQFNRTGAITCWGQICPLFKGTGWAVVLIAFYVDFFYNVIIAWCLHFFFSSFTSDLPWTSCGNDWNTDACYIGAMPKTNGTNSTSLNVTRVISAVGGALGAAPYTVATPTMTPTNFTPTTLKPKSAAAEYFERGMLGVHESSGFMDLGMLQWRLVLCLAGVFIICYFSMWKGIMVSGKVVWFTALFPYVVLTILMVRGCTLPGAAMGIKYYLTPNMTKLANSQVWVDAANQVFFSLGPGFGVLLTFASYNPIKNNVYRDALMTSVINCATSFFSGFIIFMILGYMAQRSGVDIDKVAAEGPGLVFIVYPEAIATLPGATFWAIIFFLMLLTLGLDSSFGGSEAIITALSDEFPVLRKHREKFVACLFGLYFIIGLASVSQGGMYIINLLEKFSAGYSILFAVFFEAIAVAWFYGIDRFSEDVELMVGQKPGLYWRVCWKYVAPGFLVFIIIFGLTNHQPLQYEDYEYPASANLVGWFIAMSSVMCIPGFAIYRFLFTARGSPMERLRILTRPANNREEKHRRANSMITINGDLPLGVPL